MSWLNRKWAVGGQQQPKQGKARFNCPVEIAEARYGFEVLYKSLHFGAAPASSLPGGAGVSLAYKLRAPAVLSSGYSHAVVPTWSTCANLEGGVNSLRVVRADGEIEVFSYTSGTRLNFGDSVLITTANGGSSYGLDK